MKMSPRPILPVNPRAFACPWAGPERPTAPQGGPESISPDPEWLSYISAVGCLTVAFVLRLFQVIKGLQYPNSAVAHGIIRELEIFDLPHDYWCSAEANVSTNDYGRVLLADCGVFRFH